MDSPQMVANLGQSTEPSQELSVYITQLAQQLKQLKSAHNEQLLAQTIAIARKAVIFKSAGKHPRPIAACRLLGKALQMHHERHSSITSLDEAISLFRETLSLCLVGDPRRASSCNDLAEALRIRYKSTGDEACLVEAIELSRESLFLRPHGDPNRASSCAVLAIMLNTRYESTGDDIILSEAISIQRDSVSLTPKEHSNRASACVNFANSLLMRYKTTGDTNIIDEAIEFYREALTLRPKGHPSYTLSCINLCHALRTHYDYSGDISELLEAIDIQREANSLCPKGHSLRASSCLELANLLFTYCKSRGGEPSVLDEAIALYRDSLEACPQGHPDRATSCDNIAYALRTHYDSSGKLSLLGEAISFQREAIALRPPGHPDRGLSCVNLANSLLSHYRCTEDQQILLEVIGLQRESLALCSPGHPWRATSSDNLALSLQLHFTISGDSSCLIEAIILERDAILLRPEGHPDRSFSCTNLAHLLVTRFISTGDYDLLDEAVGLQQELLELCPQGHLNHAIACDNLAHSLRVYTESSGNVIFLDEIISLQREVLSLRPREHPLRAHSCASLASSLVVLYESLSMESSVLLEAIELYRESLSITGNGTPSYADSCIRLATSLGILYDITKEEVLLTEMRDLAKDSLPMAFQSVRWRHHCVLASVHLHIRTGFYDVSKAVAYLSGALQHLPNYVPEALSQITRCLNDIWHADNLKNPHWAALLPIYQQLIELLPMLLNPVLETGSQLRALRNFGRLGIDAFVCAVHVGTWPLGLEYLEIAQGVMWSQHLHYRDPQLEKVPTLLASELKGLLQEFGPTTSFHSKPSHQPTASLTPRDIRHNQSSRIFAILGEIRALPGLDRFMLGEISEKLCSVASNHTVVVLVGAQNHFYALILAADAQNHTLIKLEWSDEDFTSSTATLQSAMSYRGNSVSNDQDATDITVSRAFGVSAPRQVPSGTLALRHLLRNSWLRIVKPILEHIQLQRSLGKLRPRLHWCPTGRFSTIPLHAAGIYEEQGNVSVGTTDYVVSSYTPTLTTLHRAQKAAAPMARRSLSMTIIAEKQAQEPQLGPIPGVETELEDVAAVARSHLQNVHPLPHPTTVIGTRDGMLATNIVHLACHGIQDDLDATKSGFCLGDGRLTIAQLMEVKMDLAFLAFLSACETAKGDKHQPEQAIHLAAAMIYVGFKSVIATMWAISDTDGPKVAKWFYEELFAAEVIDMDTVAYALDVAVGKLRNSGVPLHRWVPFIHMGA